MTKPTDRHSSARRHARGRPCTRGGGATHGRGPGGERTREGSAVVTDQCCEVVDADCKAPPGYGNRAAELLSCWGCGGDVCGPCSSVIVYKAPRWMGGTRRRRFCFNCQDSRKIGRAA